MIETKHSIGEALYLVLDDAVIKVKIVGILVLQDSNGTEITYTCQSQRRCYRDVSEEQLHSSIASLTQKGYL